MLGPLRDREVASASTGGKQCWICGHRKKETPPVRRRFEGGAGDGLLSRDLSIGVPSAL